MLGAAGGWSSNLVAAAGRAVKFVAVFR